MENKLKSTINGYKVVYLNTLSKQELICKGVTEEYHRITLLKTSVDIFSEFQIVDYENFAPSLFKMVCKYEEILDIYNEVSEININAS